MDIVLSCIPFQAYSEHQKVAYGKKTGVVQLYNSCSSLLYKCLLQHSPAWHFYHEMGQGCAYNFYNHTAGNVYSCQRSQINLSVT